MVFVIDHQLSMTMMMKSFMQHRPYSQHVSVRLELAGSQSQRRWLKELVSDWHIKSDAIIPTGFDICLVLHLTVPSVTIPIEKPIIERNPPSVADRERDVTEDETSLYYIIRNSKSAIAVNKMIQYWRYAPKQMSVNLFYLNVFSQ